MLPGSLLHFWLALSSQAAACLFCFSQPQKRLRVCQIFYGHQSNQHKACQDALRAAFEPYVKIQVDVAEMEKLKDTFARSIFYLEEKGMAKAPYHQAVQEAVDLVKKEVTVLKKAPACIPPCGYQKEARWYQCSSCSIMDCQLPIDCQIQDLHKLEGETTLLRCNVQFQIPSDCTYRWKFVRDVRAAELFLFQDMNFGYNPSLLIRPTLGSHRGSYVCEVLEENDVLVRKFFFLNVTEKKLELEKELQEMFKAILHPAPALGPGPAAKPEEVVEGGSSSLQELLYEPESLKKKSVIFLIAGIAVCSMLFTLVAMTIYHWATA